MQRPAACVSQTETWPLRSPTAHCGPPFILSFTCSMRDTAGCWDIISHIIPAPSILGTHTHSKCNIAVVQHVWVGQGCDLGWPEKASGGDLTMELRSGMTRVTRQREKEGRAFQAAGTECARALWQLGSMAKVKFRSYWCSINSKTFYFSHLNL